MTTNTSATYRIAGMDCAECARTIENGVARLDGVQSCAINFGAALLQVNGGAARDAVARRVHELGYAVVEDGQSPAEESSWRSSLAARLPERGVLGFVRFLLARSETTWAALGALLIAPGLLFGEILPALSGRFFELPALDILSFAALIAAGWPIARSAWRTLRINRTVNINGLMTLAAVGAVAIGAYAEAGLVMVLFAIGEALEAFTLDRARAALRALMQIAPAHATVLRACVDCREHLGQIDSRSGNMYRGGPCPFCGVHETPVPIEDVRIGELVLVKPGERIPVDGVVRAGSSFVDQASITGESVPVSKNIGADVFAGTIDQDGVLEIEATQRAEETVLRRIVRLVEESQARKAPSERFVDRFARVYTPAVTIGAVVMAFAPPLLFGAPFLGEQGWAYRALELLVVACPCALVVATPASVVSAIGAAARNGVLVKGGAAIEALSRVRAIAFDKTGTLTRGRLRVHRVRAEACEHAQDLRCVHCDDLLAYACALERRSSHPLARAVIEAALARGLEARYAAADNVTNAPGRGVSGVVNGRRVMLGTPAFVGAGLRTDDRTSMIAVAVDGVFVGTIEALDELRRETPAVLRELRGIGISETMMLTGDAPVVAEMIGRAAGIDQVHAGLLPENKERLVRELQEKHGAMAMVGDGINDAPALAAATVGVAMGAGAAQAMETADVTLMGDDLTRLPFVLKLSRAAMRTIRVSITFAIVVKVCVMLLVLIGAGTLWLAVAADVGAALAVTAAGMRLLRVAPKAVGG
jgi:Cd2+/Zn2+-exporting ATPase